MTNRSDIGKILRTERERKELSIHDVSHYTRIPVRALHELEEGDYSGFASLAYAKGFLAQYAKHLDLDAHEWLDDFEVEDQSLDLKSYEFLDHQEEELPPLPTKAPAKAHPVVERSRTSSSTVMQPLAVFAATAMLLGAGVFGFIKLNERFSEVSEADQPASPPQPNTIVRETTPEEAKARTVAATSNAAAGVAPPLAVNDTPVPAESFPPAPVVEEITQPLVVDTKPPRAVIVEE